MDRTVTTQLGHKIRLIEDNIHIRGFGDNDNIYIAETFSQNPIAMFHELKEAYYNGHPEELPDGINSYTFLRGCGKDVRKAYQRLETEGKNPDDMTDEQLIEALKQKLPKERLNEAEFNLIRYNAGEGRRGIERIWGMQDIEFGMELNDRFSEEIRKSLSGKIDEFYLAGGTALSLFYFQHRLSIDLDFFTQQFAYWRIEKIALYLQDTLKKKVELVAQNVETKESKILVYHIHFNTRDILKIDFVEDVLNLIKPTKVVEGIRILSLEDIYLRKLYAISGTISSIDEIGREKILGGRVEAKDFFDLYFLSHTFMAMSKFVARYGDPVMMEGLVRWFRTYDRMIMMEGILTLDVDRDIDYKRIEGHFKKEIDEIIENQLEDI